MKRSKFTDEQILAIVREGEAGRKVADLVRTHGITEQTYYRWKAKSSLLLERGQLDEQSVRIVRRIMSSSDRAVRLIGDFLDFTQARVMGRIPVSPKPASI